MSEKKQSICPPLRREALFVMNFLNLSHNTNTSASYTTLLYSCCQIKKNKKKHNSPVILCYFYIIPSWRGLFPYDFVTNKDINGLELISMLNLNLVSVYYRPTSERAETLAEAKSAVSYILIRTIWAISVLQNYKRQTKVDYLRILSLLKKNSYPTSSRVKRRLNDCKYKGFSSWCKPRVRLKCEKGSWSESWLLHF